MITALVFPGQGSQYVGMARTLLGQFPYAHAIFEEASDAIRTSISKLCESDEETLQLTVNAQPCILATSYAWFSVLKNERGLNPRAAAGHSLGEYTALVAAQALSLYDAARLVRERGKLMQEAVPTGQGKMAALIGLSDDLARELCETASRGSESIAVPANFNSPGQIVIAGHYDAVERAEQLASEKDSPYKARKVISLKVSAPFHCPLMKPVAEQFAVSLKQINWNAHRFPVIANVNAQKHDPECTAETLVEQIYSPVLWTACVSALSEMGCSHFVEPGPGKALSGLVKRCCEKAITFSIDSLEDLKKYGATGASHCGGAHDSQR